MIAGTVGAMAEGDAQRYAQIASLAAFTVAALSLFAWLLRLSVLVKLISDSILVGFKAGAGLTIAMTQLPSLFGVKGGGHNFFERAFLLAGQLGQMQYLVLAVGVIAIVLIVLGERLFPGKPVALGVVALSIAAATLLGASGAWGANDGRNPGRLAHLGRPGPQVAGRRGNRSVGRGLPAARLYRGRVCGSHLRCEARIRAGSQAGASGHRCGQSRSGDGTGFSGCGRPLAIGGERQGRRTNAAGAGLCLDHAGALPAVSDGLASESSEGGAGGGRVDRGVWPTGFSGTAPHVAREPAGFPGRERSRSSACCFLESFRVSCSPRWPRYCCCSRGCRAHMSRFLAACPAPTAIPTWTAIPRTSRCLA